MNSNWRERARCARPDFLPLNQAFFSNDPRAVDTAKRICAACPVRQQCLDAALAEEGGRHHSNRFGIRGGVTPRGRRSRYEQLRKRAQRAAA